MFSNKKPKKKVLDGITGLPAEIVAKRDIDALVQLLVASSDLALHMQVCVCVCIYISASRLCVCVCILIYIYISVICLFFRSDVGFIVCVYMCVCMCVFMCDVDALVKLLVASSDLALHMQVCVCMHRDMYIHIS